MLIHWILSCICFYHWLPVIFFLGAFETFFLSLVFSNFTKICLSIVVFPFILLSVYFAEIPIIIIHVFHIPNIVKKPQRTFLLIPTCVSSWGLFLLTMYFSWLRSLLPAYLNVLKILSCSGYGISYLTETTDSAFFLFRIQFYSSRQNKKFCIQIPNYISLVCTQISNSSPPVLGNS